tara:strand:- start:402 stop:560 length:159 start_codon:yes stop_codon:yes gene_type:complete
MQGTAIIIGNLIGGITGGGPLVPLTFFILKEGASGDNIIAEDGKFLVSELAP